MSHAAPQAAGWTRVQLAGGEAGTTLLSEAGPALLPLFSTRDACALRLVCREFQAAVSEHPWGDRGTVIKGSIAAWRACYPHARYANVQWRKAPVLDADFVHFEGLRGLYVAGCMGFTDAAFVHLHGIHILDMSHCRQARVTDAAFAHLAGIHTLDMSWCSQARITGDAFAHLRGIHTLNVSNSRLASITSAAFAQQTDRVGATLVGGNGGGGAAPFIGGVMVSVALVNAARAAHNQPELPRGADGRWLGLLAAAVELEVDDFTDYLRLHCAQMGGVTHSIIIVNAARAASCQPALLQDAAGRTLGLLAAAVAMGVVHHTPYLIRLNAQP